MKLKISFLLITSIVIITFLDSCTYRKENQPKTESLDSLIENFDEFYNKFHNDSTFQMSRIKFPLEGGSVDDQGNVEWTKENWTIMKKRIYDIDTTLYKTDFKKTSEKFVEKFWIENSGNSSEYRFELIDKKWFLVYALESNF